MGNIVGEGFDSSIRNQVNRRQKTHGSGYLDGTLRTNKELVVLNNNTAWVKLMSSVFIDDLTSINNPTIKEFGKRGADIAKAFVLFNGTSKYEEANGSTIQRGGIDFTNTLGGYDNVYGIGGSADFGLNPMMGITGIDVKHKNRGSIRTATVTVKAFNRAQFEIIDILYMRLGFSVLLEWGNSMYFKNDDTYISDGGQTNSLISDWFTNDNYQSFLTKIRKRSFASHGNYDAMLAKVSNYHWSFQKDGSYDITIDLVSMGDVIESLNVNKQIEISNNENFLSNSPLGKKLEGQSTKNPWGAEFYNKWKELDGDNAVNGKTLKENIGFNEQHQYFLAISHDESTNEKNGGFLFVKLGKILHLLDSKIVLRYKKGKFINFDYGYKDNLINIIKNNDYKKTTSTQDEPPDTVVINQMAYDINKCVVLKKFIPDSLYDRFVGEGLSLFHNYSSRKFAPASIWYAPFNFELPLLNNDSEDFDVTIGGKDYGQIMNILVNVEFVLDVIDDKTNKENGELPLIDFLKGILAGINESLGGLNELDIFIDETINTVKIIDKNSSYERGGTNITTFNLYGYNTNNTSNFIHDFNLTTEITPALSTMITVAATSNKQVVGEDNTALSKINIGLTDRYKAELFDMLPPTTIKIKKYPTKFGTVYDNQYENWLFAYKTYNYQINTSFNKSKFYFANQENLDMFDPLGDLNNPSKNKIIYTDNGTESIITLDYDVFEGTKILQGVTKGYREIETLNIVSNVKTQNEMIYKSSAYNYIGGDIVNKDKSFFSHILNIIGRADWMSLSSSPSFSSNFFENLNRKWNACKINKKDNPTFKSGFIPFNLSLTMDGLGGMKIYQKFNVDTNFMPSNYPANIEFLIKNIQHTVKDNKWITKLESFCVSKPGSDTPTIRTPNVTGPGLDLHSSITITSKYKSGTVKATYTATIDNGTPAEKDIVITFTDTLKNTDTATSQPVPLHVSIVIAKGDTSGESEGEFSDAVYGSIEQNSKKEFFKFSNDPQLGQKYYFKIGESEFESENSNAARNAKYVYNKDAEYYLSDGSPTKTFGIENYEKQQDGTDDDWGGSLQRAAVIQAVVEDHFGPIYGDKVFIPSFSNSQMKRNQLKTNQLSGYPYLGAKSKAGGDHHTGNNNAFALDFASRDSAGNYESRGSEMYAYIMDWLSTSGNTKFTDPEFRTEGKDGKVGGYNANKHRKNRIEVDGYSYQILWQIGDYVHYNHVHVGIRKI